jgi:thiamine-monophosphate kinase
LSESDVIRRILARAPTAGPAVGPGDDAAVLDGLAVTTDTMVEGVHWDEKLTAEDVGWKLVAVNVSDLAAMAAEPAWAVLALSLPDPPDPAWVEGFARGLGDAARRWGVTLAGGDTTRSPGPVVASLTLAGPVGRPVLRSGGRPGDTLWVTGELGLAAEGFLSDRPSLSARVRLRRPEPRLAVGRALAGVATAMMDLSDGLATDLPRLCAASGAGAAVRSAEVPGVATLAWRLAWGDDYELLFTTPTDAADAVASISAMHGVPIAAIGSLGADPGRILLDGAPEWPAPAFAHFAGRR